MKRWKPSVTYLGGPGRLATLRSVRVHLRGAPAHEIENAHRPRADRGPALFSWDYYAYPLWDDTPLSPELRASLQAWSDEGTRRFVDELQGAAQPEGWLVEWSDRGRVLANEAALVVGEIEYHNEATGEVERISNATTL